MDLATQGSVNGNAMTKIPGSADSGATNADGTFTADDVNRARQEGVNIGYAKGKGSAERDIPSRVRKELLGEMGFESDEDVERWKAERSKSQSKVSEHEMRSKKLETRAKEMEQQLSEAEKRAQKWHEDWFREYRGRVGVAIAHRLDLKEEYEDDLDRLLTATLKRPEGDETVLKFEYEKESVDMASRDAVDKIAATLLKRKPGWVKAANIGTTSGYAPFRSPASIKDAGERPETKEEFVKRKLGEMLQRGR